MHIRSEKLIMLNKSFLQNLLTPSSTFFLWLGRKNPLRTYSTSWKSSILSARGDTLPPLTMSARTQLKFPTWQTWRSCFGGLFYFSANTQHSSPVTLTHQKGHFKGWLFTFFGSLLNFCLMFYLFSVSNHPGGKMKGMGSERFAKMELASSNFNQR